MKVANLAEAEELLRAYWPRNVPGRRAYTLETMRNLMRALGEPQERVRVLHVAGTSGKTSTAYYAAGLLQAAGHRVGLAVSPHVYALNERVQVGGRPLDEAAFCQALGELLERAAASNLRPTYFEILNALAFWQFAVLNLDYAVVEVGLGGLLDATNVVTRRDKICVITDIGLDHQNVLGPDLASIAAQKAGIIQPGNQVFCYSQSEEIMEPIRARASKMGAALTVLRPDSDVPPLLRPLPLFQQRNFGLARAAAAYALQRDYDQAVTPAMQAQAARTAIPARMEIVQVRGKTVIFDGAHNAQKLQALAASVQARYPGQPVAAMIGFMSGDARRIGPALQAVSQHLWHLICTDFAGSDLPRQPVAARQLAREARAAGTASAEAVPGITDAWRQLLARPEPVLVVTGSFYLIDRVRPLARA